MSTSATSDGKMTERDRMTDEKSTTRSKLLKRIKNLFQKQPKDDIRVQTYEIKPPPEITSIEELIQQSKREKERKDIEDEDKYFTVKTIKTEAKETPASGERTERHGKTLAFSDNKNTDSADDKDLDASVDDDEYFTVTQVESDNDSGVFDKSDPDSPKSDIADAFGELSLDEKRKKVSKVFLARVPTRNGRASKPETSPYPNVTTLVNKQLGSGCQVTFTPAPTPPYEEQNQYLSMLSEATEQQLILEPFSDCDLAGLLTTVREFNEPPKVFLDEYTESSVYFTPPGSNQSVMSPMSACSPPLTVPRSRESLQGSPNLSDDTLLYYDDIPKSVVETLGGGEKSSLTLKQFKGMQTRLMEEMERKECCLKPPPDSRQFLKEQSRSLPRGMWESMCVKVANMDVELCYGTLHHIIKGLSDEQEDYVPAAQLYGLFHLVCDRLYAERPALFADSRGLCLLQAACLRCARRPPLARHLARCAAAAGAARADATWPLFTETDARGDTLLHALARRGDAAAGALSAVAGVRPPLFDVAHCNKEGYTALHAACLAHGDRARALHAVHALVAHAAADVWRQEARVGDTAVHLAVNSVTCDLDLVLLLFAHVEPRQWHRLARAKNRSSTTPLQYAKSAVKSGQRQNYPHEVLSFLLKCRDNQKKSE